MKSGAEKNRKYLKQQKNYKKLKIWKIKNKLKLNLKNIRLIKKLLHAKKLQKY